MRKLIIAVEAVAIAALVWPAFGMEANAQETNATTAIPESLKIHVSNDPKVIWGGGEIKDSSYSRVIVPAVSEMLASKRLAGYEWGGPSEGTVMNAMKVTLNPTHIALGQADILQALNGTPIENTGMNYNFTVVQDDIADECLYLVTKSPHYTTWGHVLENIWDIDLYTGGPLSGSYGTWIKQLTVIYPDLEDVLSINHAGGSGDILQAVIDGDEGAFGFFVTRPDPTSATFKTIVENDLTLVPVIDFDLEDVYTFKSLKVASGGWVSKPTYHDTACTQVQLITGHPDNLEAGDKRLRRLEATIERASSISGAEFKEFVVGKFTTWKDYLDSVREVGSERLADLLKASKEKIEDIANN